MIIYFSKDEISVERTEYNTNRLAAVPVFYKLFMNDRLIMGAIVMNIIILFLLSFDGLNEQLYNLEYLDNILTIFFFLEMLVKIRVMGWRNYIESGWNKMDFMIVLLTTPSVVLMFFDLPDFSLLLILRL